jgi:[acyl-carrier-protein] S-malonyltransferase
VATAFLFPGQGSVFPRMGLDLAAASREAREVFERVERLSGSALLELSRSASRERLGETGAAHLLTFAHSLAAFSVLRAHGVEPGIAAGHSLGHLSAVTAAGALELDEAVELVALRGRLLAECCRSRPGGMLAVRRLTIERIEELIGAPAGGLSIANVNGDEVVVSGDLASLREAIRALRAAGGATAPLPVAGAFHSPLMDEAARGFLPAVDGAGFRAPRVPLVSTLSGRLLATAQEVREDLRGHILNPVRWDRVLETLGAAGVRTWVEVGPGRVLTGLVLRRNRGAAVFPAESAAGLEKACRELGRAATEPGEPQWIASGS